MTATIQRFTSQDIPNISKAFCRTSSELFEAYHQEQQNGERQIWCAYVGNQFAGYVTLKWQSDYPHFASQNIPEIMDLNVLPPFRKRGIAAKLLETAEQEAAARSSIIGIGVGLYTGPDGGYGAAQRLYVKLGYIPDGNGITYNGQPVNYGEKIPLDDNLILWLTKKI